VDLYSALDDKYLVLKALRHGSHNLICKQHHACQKVIHDLSNRAILNDLERPQTIFSRSGHSLTLNISEMAKDRAIVTMEGE